MVAEKLNIPGAAKTRPSLSIPGKLIFPRLVFVWISSDLVVDYLPVKPYIKGIKCTV